MKGLTFKRLQFVTGKGGVGKSTVACVLGQYWSNREKKVLLVQLRATDSHSPILKIPSVKATITQVHSFLSTINLDPLMCLKEYLQLKTPVPWISEFLFRPSVLATVVDFVPGLADLVMMGKITHHLEEKDAGGKARFDCIIVDMPSTGHAIKMLQIAQNTQILVKRGRLAADTAHMQSLIANPAICAVHLVTLLDDMPAQEVLEAATQLQKNGWNNLGTLFVNRLRTTLEDGEPDPLQRVQENEILESVRELWVEERQKEERWLYDLSTGLAFMPRQLFTEVLAPDFGPEQLKELVGQMK